MTGYPLVANGALCDSAQTEQYLTTLFQHVDWQPGEVISLLGIGEKGTPKEGVFRERKIVAPSFMGSAHAHIKRWAENHVASFVVPAVLRDVDSDHADAKLDKVAALTAIILDIDSGDIAAKAHYAINRLGAPTITIASGGVSEGQPKQHLYWLLDEPSDEIERVAALRKALAAKVGGDQSFGRATQVVRIPGSVHAKNGGKGLCSILSQEPVDYTLDYLAEIIEGMEPMPGLPAAQPELIAPAGVMDFTPKFNTAVEALHRDVSAGGNELTRFSEATKVFGFQIAEARAGRISLQQAFENAQGWMTQHMQPPWPDGRFLQEWKALLDLDIKNKGPLPEVMATSARASPAPLIKPLKATWPLPHEIPPRPWVFGKWLQRGIVTAVVAPGGVGKSSLMAAMTLSIASGNTFLGKDIWGGPLKAWYWNLEDNGDNLARARTAAAMYHEIDPLDCADRLFVNSGPDGSTLCTAVEDRAGFTIIEPVMQSVVDAIKETAMDVIIVDPFVSSHAVNENDNNKIDAVAKAWARVAQLADCSVVLVHHSVKTRGERVTADSSRGAGALNNAARMTLVLNRMTADEMKMWDIEEGQSQRYFSVNDDKHNLSAASTHADWFKLESVNLNNATDILPSDDIGVVTAWQPPQLMDGIELHHIREIQRVLAAGTYWRDVRTGDDWAGHVVARTVKMDSQQKTSRTKIQKIIEKWLKTGILKLDRRLNKHRHMTEAVTMGNEIRETRTITDFNSD